MDNTTIATKSSCGFSSQQLNDTIKKYMCAIPRIISTSADGKSNQDEFLIEYFTDSGNMNSAVFDKSFQVQSDSPHTLGELLYNESHIKGRRVFMDFSRSSENFSFSTLSRDAYDFLNAADALVSKPYDRLVKISSNESVDFLSIAHRPIEIVLKSQ